MQLFSREVLLATVFLVLSIGLTAPALAQQPSLATMSAAEIRQELISFSEPGSNRMTDELKLSMALRTLRGLALRRPEAVTRRVDLSLAQLTSVVTVLEEHLLINPPAPSAADYGIEAMCLAWHQSTRPEPEKIQEALLAYERGSASARDAILAVQIAAIHRECHSP